VRAKGTAILCFGGDDGQWNWGEARDGGLITISPIAVEKQKKLSAVRLKRWRLTIWYMAVGKQKKAFRYPLSAVRLKPWRAIRCPLSVRRIDRKPMIDKIDEIDDLKDLRARDRWGIDVDRSDSLARISPG
jgi:hypothetical protein